MNKNRTHISFAFLCTLSLLLPMGCSERKFAEFSIDDVSKAMYFIDSTSASTDINHANVSVLITGEIDSSATITYASYPNNHDPVTYELKKGLIRINTQYDYYEGDSIWIRFVPRGSKTGRIKIRTRIN
ncbi:hypothetical protein [Emticicia sp. BO119]|uniref:hypothetical protein n=1 Tax=Emticicia sp. BO119 TaxID=2757768 RepID=UPI0015EFE077|nr:hypothetical protein [Emticicia sp. BO119]MBA4851815.1 hypothetical protein [Emticicia sp. BO119]